MAQWQHNLEREFVRVACGLTLSLTATMLGDSNGDDTVKLADYIEFYTCLSGPLAGGPPSPPSQRCLAVFDFNTDGDADLGDFAGLQTTFRGAL